MKPFDNNRLTLGEGPGYDRELDLAWWFDIVEKKLFTRQISEETTSCHVLPNTGWSPIVVGGRWILFPRCCLRASDFSYCLGRE